MLHITPTYALRTEASLTPSPSPNGEGGILMASERTLRTIGGGTQAV